MGKFFMDNIGCLDRFASAGSRIESGAPLKKGIPEIAVKSD